MPRHKLRDWALRGHSVRGLITTTALFLRGSPLTGVSIRVQRYSTAPNYPAQVVNVLLVASVIFSYMLIFGLKLSVFQWWWALIKGICTHSPCFLIIVAFLSICAEH
jgi:hypothetical protein